MATNNNAKYALQDPYPVPAVGTALVEKSSVNQTIGIKYRQKDEKTVVVVRVNPDSPLRNTQLQPGAEILAINGEAIHTIQQATNIIRDNTRLEFTITHPDVVRRKDAPCCYIEVAPTSKLSPGVSFGSCCNRTLVTVSEIFLTDLHQTRLRVGDIVLAVNGVPVWKPEQADAEQLEAARQSQAVVLYCVSMEQLLDGVARVAQRSHREMGRVYETKIKYNNNGGSGSYLIQGGKNEFAVAFNYSAMEFEIESDEWRKHLSRYAGTGAKNAGCWQTFQSLNDVLDQQLVALKCKVASNAWNHAVNNVVDSAGHHRQTAHQATKNTALTHRRPVYVVPSAPTMPLQSPSVIRRMPVATAFPVGEPGEPAAADGGEIFCPAVGGGCGAGAGGEAAANTIRTGGGGATDPSGIKTRAHSIVRGTAPPMDPSFVRATTTTTTTARR